ncbi:MAG: radical SAM protein [Bacilli bacterium]|nr:radical SAM protein [Bacilli bacterium]
MVYLYTLPGTAFNAPQINVPLLKGYLNKCGIESIQYDLSERFLETCFKTDYIKRVNHKYYKSLSESEKNTVDTIEKAIKDLKNKSINTEKIISANSKIIEYLDIIGNLYNIKWGKRGIDFKNKICTIDDVINFSYSEDNSLFDEILYNEHDLKNGDIIYLSVQFPFQLNYAIRFSRYLKNQNNNIRIILGGDYVTHIYKNLKCLIEKCNNIDGITLFGNFNNVVDLLNMFDKKVFNRSINNALYRDKKEVLLNYNIAKNLFHRKWYIPDFDGINLDNYLSNLKLISLTLNHGCYYSKCEFCSRPFYYNGYCTYDIDAILNQIRLLYENESIEAIYFIDECVPYSILIRLANYLINNKINIKWMVETRIEKEYVDSNVAKLLYKSGCREISFGIESYNTKILKKMNKGISLKEVKKVIKNFYESGISVSATFMIGYPTESIFNINKTLKFIKKYKYLDTFGLSVFSYMRNSKLVNSSNIDEGQDINLIYRTNNDNYDKYINIINEFNESKKIKEFASIRKNILYRSQYIYLDRTSYSLNYKRGDFMNKKFLFKKTNVKELKSKIYLKELKPEMTQCRIVQVDKKMKEKQND